MPYDVEVRRLDAQPVASVVIPGIRTEAAGAAFSGALPDVFSHLRDHGVEMAGPPFARYHGAGHSTDLEAGIPVAGPFPETDDIRARELPGGEAIVTHQVGSPDRLRNALAALAEWRAANGRVAGGPYWQVYLDDPATVDPSAVRTEVFEPLAPEG